MRAIISMIRMQLRLLNKNSDASHFEFLRKAIIYMNLYTSTTHHPTEEVMVEYLDKRKPGMHSICQNIQNQHKLLQAIETDLIYNLQLFKNGNIKTFLRIELGIGYYCETHIWHIELENKTVFPAAMSKLAPIDWSNIADRIDIDKDPLKNAKTLKHYGSLYDFIMESDLSPHEH